LPVAVSEAFIAAVRQTLPELPDEQAARFVREFSLSTSDALVLTSSRELADYYEATLATLAVPDKGAAKLAANWVMGEVSGLLNRDGLEISEAPVTPDGLARLQKRILDAPISGKIAKDVFEAMWQERASADAIIEARGLQQITDTGAIERAIDAVIAASPQQLADYRAGKDKLFGYFVGQVMKATQGKANPQALNELLKRKLSG
jgi:aspartyl-tRNA(Asn)/glutamyl-tRNA(Gln) amidotransferase subunit B